MRIEVIFETFRTFRILIRWAGIVLVTYITADVLKALADRELIKLNVLINTLLNISLSVYISYAIAISATIYGLVERRLRRKRVSTLTERIDFLEKKIWPDKTSSEINKDGTTRREDQ